MDEVRVYDRALSGADLVAIVNADDASTPAGVWTFDDAAGTTAAPNSLVVDPASATAFEPVDSWVFLAGPVTPLADLGLGAVRAARTTAARPRSASPRV